MTDSTLLLEGGAMRGVFTCGVLDAWSDAGVIFPRIAAISAGTLQALSYLSRQPGRNIHVDLTYASDRRYMGVRHLWKEHSYFNFDFVLGELSQKLVPFDMDTFRRAGEKLYAVVTDCSTAGAGYHCNQDYEAEEFLDICRASCSIPVFCRSVNVDGRPCVDGGVAVPAAPMPEELPFSCGKPVYILTRERGYRKPPVPVLIRRLAEYMYRKYPQLIDAIEQAPKRYNKRVERIEHMEQDREAFVIRPRHPVEVKRNERNVQKLRGLYEEGRTAGQARLNDMQKWLGKSAETISVKEDT